MHISRRAFLGLGVSVCTGCRVVARDGVLVFAGDSITAGNHVGAGEDYPTLVGGMLGGVIVNNLAVPSSTIGSGTQGSDADALYNGSKPVNVCCVMWGINDLAGGASPATAKASLKTWCLARKAAGFVVAVLTILPCNTFGNANALRNEFNALVRADRSFYDLLIDVGITSTTMGADAAVGNVSLYSDGVHPTYAGNQLLAATSAQALVPRFSGVSWRGF
jgi:lysophospholipase L1-like esterase